MNVSLGGSPAPQFLCRRPSRSARASPVPPPLATPIISRGSSSSRCRRCRSTASSSFSDFSDFVGELQQGILKEAEGIDGSGKAFLQDRWQREVGNPNAGYGITSVLEGGDLLEKAAANITVVRGTLTAARAQSMSSRGRRWAG